MIRQITLFCCLAGLALPADQPPQPVIKVNTRLVVVDAVVRTKSGPVANLTKDDFTLLDDRKPQKIAVFSVKSISHGTIADPSAKPLAPGTVANRVNSRGQEPEAATVVLWDALNTESQDQAYVRLQVLKYLQTMKAGDPIALYSMTKTLKVVQDFTDDPARLIKAVTKKGPEQSTALAAADLGNLASQVDNPSMGDLGPLSQTLQNAAQELQYYEMNDRVRLTRVMLMAIAEHLSGLPGRKKLVWFTAAFAITQRTQHTALNSTSGAGGGEIMDFGPELDKAIKALNNANVAVYPIDPRGLTTGASDLSQKQTFDSISGANSATAPGAAGLSASGIDAMNLVASGTGGQASYGGNDLDKALKNAMEDDEVTYTLGFYSPNEKLDGSYHNLSVKVDRKGVDVRSRKGYFSLDSKTAYSGQWRETLNESMGNPLESTSLGLRARAVPVANQPGVYSLEVTIDLSELHLEREKDRWIALISYATRFSPSPTTKGTLETLRISLTEEKLKAALKDGYLFRRSLQAGDIKGDLRVAVEDRTTGTIGSVSVPIGKE